MKKYYLLFVGIVIFTTTLSAQTASTWPHNNGKYGKGTRFISVFNEMTKNITVYFRSTSDNPTLVKCSILPSKDTIVQLPNSWSSGQIYATYDTSYQKPYVSLGEWTLGASGAGYADFYDVSFVDAFSLPMLMGPVVGTYTKRRPAAPDSMYDCGAVRCTTDLIPICPLLQQKKNAAGVCIACLSGCQTAHQNNWPQARIDSFCCSGHDSIPATCPAYTISNWFKQLNSDGYSYAYDDLKSTFVCVPPTADHYGPDYYVIFGTSYPPSVQDPRKIGTSVLSNTTTNMRMKGLTFYVDRHNILQYNIASEQFSQMSLSIYSCNGMLVSKQSLNCAKGKISMASLPPGAYVLNINSARISASQSVFVTKNEGN